MNLESGPNTNTSESDNDREYAFSVKTAQSSTRQTDNHNVNKLNLAKELPMSTVTVGHRTHESTC